MHAANDTTEPATLTVGATYETAAWRARRSSCHIEVTSLANAGKRGKTCQVHRVIAGLTNEETLDLVAPFVVDAVLAGVSPETMADVLADVELAGLRFEVGTARGVDVCAEPAILVQVDLVDARFTPREALVRFTALFGAKRAQRQDTIVGTYGPKDAAKAYRWARENRARLATMDLSTFRAEMSRIGARLS